MTRTPYLVLAVAPILAALLLVVPLAAEGLRLAPFGDEPLGSQLGEIVAERGKRIAVGGASERLDDVRVDLRSGKAIAGGDVREAHEGVHHGELAGMIEPQSRNAFPCRE